MIDLGLIVIKRMDNSSQQLGRIGNVLEQSLGEQEGMTSHPPHLPAPLMIGHPPPTMLAVNCQLKSVERRDIDVLRRATRVVSQPR